MMVLIFSIVILLFATINLIAYKTFVTIFPVFASKHLFLIRIIFLVLMLSFILASFMARYDDSFFAKIFYTISASWFGFLSYLFLVAVLYSIILIVFHFISPNFSVLWIGKILFCLLIILGVYGLYNAQKIIITKVNISIPNLPESWKGRKAVFISDIHFGPIYSAGTAREISKKIEELNPDIVFNGGDTYDGVGGDVFTPIKLLADFKPYLGHYFVTGNHEEYGNKAGYLDAIKKAGIKILNNEAVVVEGVNIVGVDFTTTSKKEDFKNILDGISLDSKNPSILLKHVPFDLGVASDKGIDLQLSGHTHRGQAFPLSFISNFVYKGYDYGLKTFNSMQVLVTDGVGTWGPPMRVGTHSEIVLITFE
ncbi:MAG: metallophosphoesterase [Burkholderiales bacterium]|nr:metallophosphoesterase [Burkholderiales bacterium]